MAKAKAKKKAKPAKKAGGAKKKGRGGAGNAAFMAPKKLSPALAEIVGNGPMPRSEVVKKLWAYIHKHGLQDKVNKRQINPDESFGKVFGNRPFSMFEMNKLLGKHVS